jgi:hypothetical protein
MVGWGVPDRRGVLAGGLSPALSLCLGALACRFDDSGSGKSEQAGTEDSSTGSDAESGTRGDSGEAGSDDGSGEGSGDGAGCSNDDECPPDFVCVPPECINPEEGKACATDLDCTPLAPHCGPDGGCHDGTENDPCYAGFGCAEAPYCVDGKCRYGLEGDPCVTALDCDPVKARFCGPDGNCHDGSPGDPCLTDLDCQQSCLDGKCG